MRWNELVQQVRASGQYATDAEAERVLRTVLTVLGTQTNGDERRELVRLLPVEAAVILARQTPAARSLTAPEFVDTVAARLGGLTAPAARWGVSSVLGVVADCVGDDLTRRITAGLPRGYALLFGRAELAPAAA
ncbi:DUF2267 domain-containing protein [Streptomyces sp. ISL-96]|uniref:DUF2267 domain-containing protein n=1 Tax=Streptomyces sp. ISL-96 TaxID=2819191 RepID=UPI001BE946DC|nr:DUF2267 domain-containing protein [Streptomyces sp. ISL-96]MBT2489576.1 DUF2267 domain-containing protein [Streptomyces sp. ISL-96]